MHYAAGYRSVMSTPGERLQTARKARGYETATDAANALGIPVATYTQHENGLRGFPAKRAPQYARFFGVSTDWLLFNRGDGPSEVARALPPMVPILGVVGARAGGPPSGGLFRGLI